MPELRRNKGAIVLTASVQGMAAQKGALAYVVSKHGMIGLVTGMAMDEAANGVRVLGVAPGSVETPMLRWAINLDPNPDGARRRGRCDASAGPPRPAERDRRGHRLPPLRQGLVHDRRNRAGRWRHAGAHRRRAPES